MDTISELVKSLVQKYGKSRESLLPVMQGVVEQERYLSEYSMIKIAEELNISATEVFGTASFYSFLETRKMGKNVIRVCKTITCSMKGKTQIIHAIEGMLKIKVGETTHDGMFTLLQTNCLGWCHEGPALLINNNVYSNLTPEKIREILREYMSKK
jgi:NADH:ubiquinone oxidoreductase subunit E